MRNPAGEYDARSLIFDEKRSTKGWNGKLNKKHLYIQAAGDLMNESNFLL